MSSPPKRLPSLPAAGQSVRFSPRGVSMLPMLRQGRDSVVLSPAPKQLRKYDLPLYRRDDGSYVLHRVVKAGQTYACMGGQPVCPGAGAAAGSDDRPGHRLPPGRQRDIRDRPRVSALLPRLALQPPSAPILAQDNGLAAAASAMKQLGRRREGLNMLCLRSGSYV